MDNNTIPTEWLDEFDVTPDAKNPEKSELTALLAVLAKHRNYAEHLAMLASKLEQVVQSIPEYQAWKDMLIRLSSARAMREEVEIKVRELTILVYNANPEGGKKPAPGVGIRVSRVPAYDPARARQYCLDKLPGFMILDTKKFDKIALDLGLDFVTAEETVSATIASDLSDYLPAEPSPAAQQEPTGAAADDEAA